VRFISGTETKFGFLGDYEVTEAMEIAAIEGDIFHCPVSFARRFCRIASFRYSELDPPALCVALRNSRLEGCFNKGSRPPELLVRCSINTVSSMY
jgi:hypothetical protein